MDWAYRIWDDNRHTIVQYTSVHTISYYGIHQCQNQYSQCHLSHITQGCRFLSEVHSVSDRLAFSRVCLSRLKGEERKRNVPSRCWSRFLALLALIFGSPRFGNFSSYFQANESLSAVWKSCATRVYLVPVCTIVWWSIFDIFVGFYFLWFSLICFLA